MTMHSLTVPVWDIFVRLFHWLLVAAIAFAWWTVEQEDTSWMEWHKRSGYVVLGLVIFRVLWGIWGPLMARFRHFLYGVVHTLRYGRLVWQRREPPYLSHNPLGGWAVVALLLLCGVQAATGLFANDDIMTEGPLAALVGYELSLEITRWHKQLSDILLGIIVLHMVAVFYHQWARHEALLQAMWHGNKPAAGAADRVGEPLPRRRILLRAVVLAAAAASVVWGVINL